MNQLSTEQRVRVIACLVEGTHSQVMGWERLWGPGGSADYPGFSRFQGSNAPFGVYHFGSGFSGSIAHPVTGKPCLKSVTSDWEVGAAIWTSADSEGTSL